MNGNKGKCLLLLFIMALVLTLNSPRASADLCGGSGYDPLSPALSRFNTDPLITLSLPTIDIPADFGGVSLSKTADLMLNITDISGAAFDEATGQIILYGKSPVSLPQMKLDDLAVAVRSEYGYGGKAPQDPGVSIGTEASTIPGQMKVRYDGQTLNTGFGYTMFESDRILKALTLGKDNITNAVVTSTVPGYLNLPDRYRNLGWYNLPPTGLSNRMWFVPKEVSLITSTDDASMVFDKTSMKLLTESKYRDNVTGDAVAEAFAAHFTQHYDEFAAERPMLAELKRLGKITAVVKWIRDNNIPFDLSYFDSYIPAYDDRTPGYTPEITVHKIWEEYGIRVLSMTGGVQYLLDATNFATTQGAAADQTQTAVLTSRPGEGNFNWNFSSGGQSYQAIAHSMSRARKDGNVRRTEIDMMFPVQGNNPLILYRYYNSFNDKSTGFGFGWETSPYKLRFPATKLSFSFSSGTVTVSAHYQIFVNEKGREHLFTLVGLDPLKKPIYAREGGKDYLKAEGSGFVLYKKNQGTVTFDSDGKFTRITDGNGIYIDYAYSGTDLVSITHQAGRSITLNYSSGKIVSAVGPGGKTITYTYNAKGDLETAKNEENEAVTYQYDADRRLTNIIDPRGNDVFRASFDDYNRATGQTLGSSASYARSFNLAGRTSTITDPKNVSYTQTFDADYRLLNMTDSANRKVNVTYAGEFGPATVTDSNDNTTQYGYDDAGNIDYVRDAKGYTRLFAYDEENNPALIRDGRGHDTAYVYDLQNRLIEIRHIVLAEVGADGRLNGRYSYDPAHVTVFIFDQSNGNLLSVRDPDGRLQQFTYDGNGLSATTMLQGGYTITNTYDSRSRLQNVTNPAGEGITYGYDAADRVTSITTSAAVIRYAYDRNGNVGTAYDGRNNATVYEYNVNNKVTKVTDSENGLTGYQYDATGTRLTRITLPNGTIKDIEYDNLNRPIRENSQVPDSAPKPVVLQSAVSMGSVTAGVPSTQHVSICNSGQASTSIANVTSSNALFSVSPTSVALSPQQCADLAVTFNGTSMGSQNGTLTITYGDGTLSTLSLSAQVAVFLNVSVISASNGINVSWSQYTDPLRFSHYRVYRSTSAITTIAGLTPLTTISAIGTIGYTDSSAVIGTKYYYAVMAFDSGSNMLTGVVSAGPINFLNIGKVGGPLTLTPTLNGGRSPAVAFNGNASYRDYFVVYEYDSSGTGSNWDIYGQRISGEGQKIGSPFAIMSGGYTERKPRVTYNSTDNEYMVIAEYDSNGAGLYQVRGQRVTADGLPAGATFTVFEMTVPQYAPDIAYNSRDNNYLVAFQADYTGEGKDDILSLQMSSAGTVLAGAYRNHPAGSFRNPRLAFNATANEYFEVFEYLDSSNYLYIHGLRLDPAGNALTNNLAVDGFAAYNGYYPDVVYNPTDNQYAVAWQYGGSSYTIYVRKVAADGTLGAYTNYSAGGYHFLWPAIRHFEDKNEFLLAFTCQATTGGEYDAIAQRIFTSDLGLVTTHVVEISADAFRIERTAIPVYNPVRAEFLSAFEYVSGTDLDIRTQRIGNITENLSVSPSSLDFGSSVSELTVHVADTSGQGYIYLNNWTDRPWLSVYPGLVYSSNSSTDLTVTVNRNLLGVGSHSGNVLTLSHGLVTQVPVAVTVVNSTPSIPFNPMPQNGSSVQFNVGSNLTAALGWNCSDPNYGDTVAYDLYLSENQSLISNSDPSVRIAVGMTAKTAATPTLGYGKTYYWRVKASDSYGAAVLGPVWSFTTVPIPAPAVIAYIPNTTRNTSPTLSWSGIAGIGKYRLQVANTPAFSTLLADHANVVGTIQLVGQILPDGKIYWRVAGIDNNGVQGTYSPVSEFTIDTVPPAVHILSPVGLVDRTQMLNYTVSDGTVKVKVDGIAVSKVSGNILDPLESGEHILRVESLDVAGNLGFAETTFIVPPEVGILFSGTGSGSVTSTPPGVACNSECYFILPPGTLLTLMPTASEYSLFGGWSNGLCAGLGGCQFPLQTDTVVTATFARDTSHQVSIDGTIPVYYSSIQDAYNDAPSESIIRLWAIDYNESVTFDRPVSVTVQGGFSGDYTSITGSSVLNGTLTIIDGTVAADGLAIK